MNCVIDINVFCVQLGHCQRPPQFAFNQGSPYQPPAQPLQSSSANAPAAQSSHNRHSTSSSSSTSSQAASSAYAGSFNCQEDFGFYPHVKSCDKYWACDNGKFTLSLRLNYIFVTSNKSKHLKTLTQAPQLWKPVAMVWCSTILIINVRIVPTPSQLSAAIDRIWSHQLVLLIAHGSMVSSPILAIAAFSTLVGTVKPHAMNVHLVLPMTMISVFAFGLIMWNDAINLVSFLLVASH